MILLKDILCGIKESLKRQDTTQDEILNDVREEIEGFEMLSIFPEFLHLFKQ